MYLLSMDVLVYTSKFNNLPCVIGKFRYRVSCSNGLVKQRQQMHNKNWGNSIDILRPSINMRTLTFSRLVPQSRQFQLLVSFLPPLVWQHHWHMHHLQRSNVYSLHTICQVYNHLHIPKFYFTEHDTTDWIQIYNHLEKTNKHKKRIYCNLSHQQGALSVKVQLLRKTFSKSS